ncbi:hypothetical protein ACFL4T_01015 [candidate division KSB1 bacterium]
MSNKLRTSILISILIILIGGIFSSSYSQSYLPGKTYYGDKKYIEYLPGTLPVILSAPHGGTLKPSDIPDRTYGSFYQDMHCDDLVKKIRDSLYRATGKYPHVVICNLHRRKLDANRDINEAAQGNTAAEQAWKEWNEFLEHAKKEVETEYGTGFYFDIHGFRGMKKWLQLGYLIRGRDFDNVSDEDMNKGFFGVRSSIRYLAENSEISFAELVRGDSSLGALFEEEGYPAVPSNKNKGPGNYGTYFNGGYNTYRHGSLRNGKINAIQIETYYEGIRDTEENRKKFAEKFTQVLKKFLTVHMNFFIKTP